MWLLWGARWEPFGGSATRGVHLHDVAAARSHNLHNALVVAGRLNVQAKRGERDMLASAHVLYKPLKRLLQWV
jgi:hypothetical protein